MISMKGKIFIAILACACSFSMLAAPQKADKRSKWLKEVQDYKHDMLVEEAEMTEEQKKEFLPLYSDMEAETYQANVEARQLEAKISSSTEEVTDLEYEVAAKALAEVKLKEAQIEMTYYEKFEKILSKKQLFLLKRAENRFTRDMLNHNKRGKTSKNNNKQ